MRRLCQGCQWFGDNVDSSLDLRYTCQEIGAQHGDQIGHPLVSILARPFLCWAMKAEGLPDVLRNAAHCVPDCSCPRGDAIDQHLDEVPPRVCRACSEIGEPL